MDVLIFGNGEFKNRNLLDKFLKFEDVFVIGVDGGCDYLIENKIKIDLAIGDFDSIKYKNVLCDTPNILKTDMDISDLEFAINYCLDKNFCKMYLFGFTGRRADHFLFNLRCLGKAFNNGVEIFVIDEFNIITLLLGERDFQKENFKFFSVIPMYDNTVISIEGSKYDLKNENINLLSTLTLSNEWEKEKIKISSNKLVYVCLVF